MCEWMWSEMHFEEIFLGREEFDWFYDSASVFIVFLALFSLGKFYKLIIFLKLSFNIDHNQGEWSMTFSF